MERCHYTGCIMMERWNCIPSVNPFYAVFPQHPDAVNLRPVDLTDVTRLRLEILATNGLDRAQVYGIRVLGEGCPERVD
jgi:hypothetical protein